MKYVRIITQFANSIWAIQQDKFLQIRDFLLFKAAGNSYSSEEMQAAIGAKAERKAPQANAIAVIPIYGVVSQRLNVMEEICGSGSAATERIMHDFRSAIADPTVSAIVLDIDSPGGSVFGVSELATEIYKARGKKPIAAVANSLAASAAYWIGSAADEFFVTPSGEAGSIGVFAEHTDISKFLEMKGVKPTLISAGEFKTEGNSYQPLGDDATAYLQGRVNDLYEMFVGDVARNRGVTKAKVKKDFGGGRVFGAEQAVASGMADKIATLDQVLRKYGSTGSRAASDLPVMNAESFNPDIERRKLEVLSF